jgi:L-ectoine synthase
MLVRSLDEVISTELDVDWGNGTSQRLLVANDGRGYTITDTRVRPGTRTLLRYDNHLESCYCVEGSGRVETAAGSWEIGPGTLYAPERGEEHELTTARGLRLICVFNPALRGDENHRLAEDNASGY